MNCLRTHADYHEHICIDVPYQMQDRNEDSTNLTHAGIVFLQSAQITAPTHVSVVFLQSAQIAAPTLLANTHELLSAIESVHAEGHMMGSHDPIV